MSEITVVGSGASAVHCALTLLEKGYGIHMLDVGRDHPEPVRPGDTLQELKDNLDKPADYFLGPDLDSVVFPGQAGEYYGFPPSKMHVFASTDEFPAVTSGFQPLTSLARGGLAEAWTGGVYPLNDGELSGFPFSFHELSPFYDLVARRIGISGTVDDLSRFMPIHDNLMTPLELDEHSDRLLRTYERKRRKINSRYNAYLGRSRIATVSSDFDGRQGCSYLGRCLWGCPREALYTPSVTLRACQSFERFRYTPGQYVTHFEVDRHRRLRTLHAVDGASGAVSQVRVDRVILSAGTLSTSKIYLESVLRHTGEVLTLKGLMDNRQLLVPFVNLSMLGKRFEPNTYQYHQLGLGLEENRPEEYVHAQITTLKTAPLHPIVQRLPFDLRSSLYVYRNVHAALGLLNVNFFDTRRDDNTVTLGPERHGRRPLAIHYVPPTSEPRRVARTTRALRRVLRSLNCLVAPGLSHRRPMGSSVHYAGLLPMSTERVAHTTSAYGQSHDFENLFIVDGTTLPFLPAKNLTFTLMANAARIASHAF